MLGFGFVEFETDDVVQQVCDTHFHQLNGKTVCFSHFCSSCLNEELGGKGDCPIDSIVSKSKYSRIASLFPFMLNVDVSVD